MEHLSYERRQKDFGLFNLAMREDMISLCKYIGGLNTRESEGLCKLKDNVGTRPNRYKLAMNKFSLEIRRRFLTIRGVRF